MLSLSQHLNQLKDNFLKHPNNPYINAYVDNEYLEAKEYGIDDSKSNYIGISDNKGNYFYVIDTKTYEQKQAFRGGNKIAYQRKSKLKFVSVLHGKINNEDLMLFCMDMITKSGGEVFSVDLNNSSVFLKVTGKLPNNNLNNLNLLTMDYYYTDIISLNKCEYKICDCL